jgi:hypothetical protein
VGQEQADAGEGGGHADPVGEHQQDPEPGVPEGDAAEQHHHRRRLGSSDG